MLEIQDIFQQYGEKYREMHRLTCVQSKVIRDITNCRTNKLGGHLDVCHSCGYAKISYNSCRNRHCPKCQTFAKERWIENQRYDLLNVGYFHVVFTVPSELNSLVYQNQKTMYTLLFQTIAETLKELAADKKYLGANIGFTSVLHTWGQNLMFHPHIHCIVPGGGLNPAESWVNSRKKFFLPVNVLSRKFKFCTILNLQNLNFTDHKSICRTQVIFKDYLIHATKRNGLFIANPHLKMPPVLSNILADTPIA